LLSRHPQGSGSRGSVGTSNNSSFNISEPTCKKANRIGPTGVTPNRDNVSQSILIASPISLLSNASETDLPLNNTPFDKCQFNSIDEEFNETGISRFCYDPTHECGSSPARIQQYISRISGSLANRIDIHIDVPAVKYRELIANDPSENSATICERVAAARKVQQQRYASEKLFSNAQMGPRLIRKYCLIDDASQRLLEQAITKRGLSARAYDRILKVARTIADLEGREKIVSTNISEAIQYRSPVLEEMLSIVQFSSLMACALPSPTLGRCSDRPRPSLQTLSATIRPPNGQS
jgi:hypothetical protein